MGTEKKVTLNLRANFKQFKIAQINLNVWKECVLQNRAEKIRGEVDDQKRRQQAEREGWQSENGKLWLNFTQG